MVTTSSVTVTWTTDEPSTSQVDYGSTTSYAQKVRPQDPRDGTQHITLTGLTANATSTAPLQRLLGNNRAMLYVHHRYAAPSVPTGLTASAVSLSQINLAWNAATDNVAVAGYQVLRNGVPITTGITTAATTHTDTGLYRQHQLRLHCQLLDAAGNSRTLRLRPQRAPQRYNRANRDIVGARSQFDRVGDSDR